jgi:hypothetical protein
MMQVYLDWRAGLLILGTDQMDGVLAGCGSEGDGADGLDLLAGQVEITQARQQGFGEA